MFLIMVGQVAESAQWPKKTKWGLQCLTKSHCKNTKKYNGKPAVCRKKVKSNKSVSKNKYCLKALWDGAPCNNSDQCSSGICDGRKCSKKLYAKEVKTYTAEDATKPSFSDLDNLKNGLIEELNKLRAEIENLKKSPMCHWNGHDRILIKPRDFFQISGEELDVHTNYYDGGGAVEAHDNYDLLAQYTIPKNCIATEVTISLNQDCSGFNVLSSKLLHKKADKVFESDINPQTKWIGGAVIKESHNLKDTQFTTISAKISPIDTSSNVLSIRILDEDARQDLEDLSNFFGYLSFVDPTGIAFLHYVSVEIAQAVVDNDHCDVSGGYIKLEPVAGDSASNTESKNSTQQTPATKKKKLSQILVGEKKPIKVMGKPKTPIAVTGKPKLVAVSISQTCGKGQAFQLDCIDKNACLSSGDAGWVVGNIQQPIKAKMYKGNDLSLGKGYTFWQNEANKCALMRLDKPILNGTYKGDPNFGKSAVVQTCAYSTNCGFVCKCQQ